jgi:hypothetical protein
MTHKNPHHERLDEATRRRLSRLASKPVDTTRLEARLRKAIQSQPSPPAALAPPAALRWWRPVSRIAAVVAVVGLIGLLLVPIGNGPAVASTTDLARVHREVTSGDRGLVPAANFDEASDVIQRLWPGAPELPEPTVGQVTASCLHSVANHSVACLKLAFKGQPITMVVGHSREVVCSTEHRRVSRENQDYLVHDRDGVQMVMVSRQGRWVCLMGRLSIDELIEIADGLRF